MGFPRYGRSSYDWSINQEYGRPMGRFFGRLQSATFSNRRFADQGFSPGHGCEK
jgi:hypothetical protein